MSQQQGKTPRNGRVISSTASMERPASAGADSMTDSSSFPSMSPSPEPSSSSPHPTAGDSAHQLAMDQDQGTFSSATDGLTERLFRSKSKGPVAAIFIHAGAGFHSMSNENLHLEACSDAARLAMKFLKAGATAVDAVEAAIKCLEDKEITNAGFGSNLSVDGNVEGDATIVDHLGRSGACGAVPMIKNPISLARLILDKSNVPLSLRRIPPNILVGAGAKQFAEEYGMRLVANEQLVSAGARDRFCRWRQDLLHAEIMAQQQSQAANLNFTGPFAGGGNVPIGNWGIPAPARLSSGTEFMHNPGSASYPQPTTAANQQASRGSKLVSNPPYQAVATDDASTGGKSTNTPVPLSSSSAPATHISSPPRTTTPHPKRLRLDRSGLKNQREVLDSRKKAKGSGDSQDGFCDIPTDVPATAAKSGLQEQGQDSNNSDAPKAITLCDNDTDIITDTVGAIAIDLWGNIAAGSSSGGIGMKHSGRIGPAALVGIGTAVIPVDPKDDSDTTVAAVTSGTGEHMATTMASHTCAERLYYNLRRAEGGSYVSECDEDILMKSFVVDDFMNHPGVKNQISGGAIGVMAVKRTYKGIYFYFAHNTDSFALASMASTDKEPLVVMSRMGSRESVARGGRRIKTY